MLMAHPHPELQFTHLLPYGALVHDRGVQFVVFSRSATAMRLLLYDNVDDRGTDRNDSLRSGHGPLGRHLEHLRSRHAARASSTTSRPTAPSTRSAATASTARPG